MSWVATVQRKDGILTITASSGTESATITVQKGTPKKRIKQLLAVKVREQREREPIIINLTDFNQYLLHPSLGGINGE